MMFNFSGQAVGWSILLCFLGLLLSYSSLHRSARPNPVKATAYTVHPYRENDTIKLAFQLVPDSIPDQSPNAQLRPSSKVLAGESFTFNQNPTLMVWMFVISMMVATAAGLLLPTLYRIGQLVMGNGLPLRTVLTSVIITTLIAVAAFFISAGGRNSKFTSPAEIIREFHVLLYDLHVVNLIIGFTFVPGALAMLGMLLVNGSITQLPVTNQPADQAISAFTELRSHLNYFLSAFSVLIVYSVITTSFLQQSVQNVLEIRYAGPQGKPFPLFPSENVYLYGAVFTIILIIFYYPIAQQLKRKGIELKAWLATQGTVLNPEQQKALTLEEVSVKNVQVFLSILGPLLGSVFSEFIKNISIW
jgi:hypothetical protein